MILTKSLWVWVWLSVTPLVGFIWGSDYNLTNYDFRKTLELSEK